MIEPSVAQFPRKQTAADEKETHIIVTPQSDKACIFSSDINFENKLLAKVKDEPEARAYRKDAQGTFFVIPKKWVNVKPNRKMTDKQREAMSKFWNKDNFNKGE